MDEVQEYLKELYEEGKAGNMWSEAQAQCLESWLECGDEEFTEFIVEDLAYKTECWLEGKIADAEEEELAEGGIYHWMVIAMDGENYYA